MQGKVSPTRGMSDGSIGMTGLPAKLRAETTHPGDPAQEIATVTRTARDAIAQKRRPVINDPINGVLTG